MSIGQPDADNPLLRFSSQVILGCVKVTVKAITRCFLVAQKISSYQLLCLALGYMDQVLIAGRCP